MVAALRGRTLAQWCTELTFPCTTNIWMVQWLVTGWSVSVSQPPWSLLSVTSERRSDHRVTHVYCNLQVFNRIGSPVFYDLSWYPGFTAVLQQLLRDFTQTHKFQPHDSTRKEVRCWPKSAGFVLWQQWITLPYIAIHFQSGPKWWRVEIETIQPTEPCH